MICRLTNLTPNLLDAVDEKKIAFIQTVELSYLKKTEQKWLYNILEREEYYVAFVVLARKLKGISQNGNLTEEKIEDMILDKVKAPLKQFKFPERY